MSSKFQQMSAWHQQQFERDFEEKMKRNPKTGKARRTAWKNHLSKYMREMHMAQEQERAALTVVQHQGIAQAVVDVQVCTVDTHS